MATAPSHPVFPGNIGSDFQANINIPCQPAQRCCTKGTVFRLVPDQTMKCFVFGQKFIFRKFLHSLSAIFRMDAMFFEYLKSRAEANTYLVLREEKSVFAHEFQANRLSGFH